MANDAATSERDALLLANFTRKSLFLAYVSRDEAPLVSSYRDERIGARMRNTA